MTADRDSGVGGLESALRRALADGLALLERNGAREIAAEVGRSLTTDDAGLPTLVVCGEAKRGKSTLVNAVLGRPHLSPVDVDVKTATYVTFRPAMDGAPEQAQIVLDDGETREVPVEELGDWVAVGGRQRGTDRGVVGAVVDLVETALEGLVLVDTPGVGGLDSSHTRLALHAIGDGDALLFVSDAGSELTRPELQFLEMAAERIDRVVFVVAKRDKHPRSWQEVVDRNRALLGEHAPRFVTAPMLPVSAIVAEQAAAESDPQVRDLLWRRSGLTDLFDVVQREVVDARQELAAKNAARIVCSHLAELEKRLARQVEAARADPGVEEQAEEERATLQRLRDNADHWQHELSRNIERARADAQDDLERTFVTLEHGWSGRIGELKGRALEDETALQALAADFEASLVEASTLVVERHIQRAADVTEELAGSLDMPVSHLPDPTGALAYHRLPPSERRTPANSGGPARWMPYLQAGMAGKVGVMVAGSLGAVGAFPVAIGGGVAIGAYKVLKRFRHADEERAALHRWVRETIARSKFSTRTGVDAVFREMRPELMRAVQRHLKDRVAELTEVIEEAQAASRKDRKTRQARVIGLESIQKNVTEQLEGLEAALAASTARAGVTDSATSGTSA